ncbi:MAG: hypothetical protein AB1744_15625, partial [Candidatus Zixiibacteriota bacterium]
YVINPDEFDINNIYIDVKLAAEVPTDRVARTNNAVLMHTRLNYPLEKALEQLGENDPKALLDQWMREQIKLTEHQIDIQDRLIEAQANQQRKLQELQQMAQFLSQRQPAFENIRGQGYNPAEGGQPPAQVAPELIREVLSGRTRTGEELAGV